MAPLNDGEVHELSQGARHRGSSLALCLKQKLSNKHKFDK